MGVVWETVGAAAGAELYDRLATARLDECRQLGGVGRSPGITCRAGLLVANPYKASGLLDGAKTLELSVEDQPGRARAEPRRRRRDVMRARGLPHRSGAQ